MNFIVGKEKSLRGLLSGTKYTVDYYQREYRWRRKQVNELIDDLTDKFLESYDQADERINVQSYGNYFLGSIIISKKNGKSYIVDGQQRLTTLSLLLIYLRNIQGDRSDRVRIEDLIFSEQFGKKSFNIDVEERTPCMEALFNGQDYDPNGRSESVKNIMARYHDIGEFFPDDINDTSLPYFIDWLIEKVYLVEITAETDEDAYTIFETMNDRGLSLSPLDMLRGFILANISDERKRTEASEIWKQRLTQLRDIGKDEDADAIKTWLRSQYSQNIRERKRGAQPQDYDRLGTEFHRWVRDNEEQINLKGSDAFYFFVQKDLNFYTRQYLNIRNASNTMLPGYDVVFFVSQFGFTLQYPVMLAPLDPKDDDEIIRRKIRVVAAYIDILLARRLWNFRSISYSNQQYAMFNLMKNVRRKSLADLAEYLKKQLDADAETFESNQIFRKHQQNPYSVFQILARITDFIETSSGMPSRYLEYVRVQGVKKHEIEHIWANHPERHMDEFNHPSEFLEYRNRIGGLILLPKQFNASYNDREYEVKLKQYLTQNLLARSLHPDCYVHHPGFISFKEKYNLPFIPHVKFKKADLDARQHLYGMIAERLWDSSRVLDEVSS